MVVCYLNIQHTCGIENSLTGEAEDILSLAGDIQDEDTVAGDIQAEETLAGGSQTKDTLAEDNFVNSNLNYARF